MSESTEFLLHLLRSNLDDLKTRMREEQERETIEMHYHYVTNYTCNTAGCAGVDPVLATYSILQEELTSINQTFPHHILSARHIP